MVEVERRELKRLIGEVQFGNLELAFRNGDLWTGPEYSAGYSFLGFDGVRLAGEDDGNYHFYSDIKSWLADWFTKDFPEHSVSEWVDEAKRARRQGATGDSAKSTLGKMQTQGECLANWTSAFLSNEQIKDYLIGIRSAQDPSYWGDRTRWSQTHFTPQFLSGLVFGGRSKTYLNDLRQKALAVMFDGSFPGLVEELIFKKGFRLEKIEPGSHYETLQRGEVVRNFSRGLFNAMCEDARVHSESNYFTSVKRLK